MVTARQTFLAANIVLATALGATAQERREYDPMVEKWTARQVSTKLGDLRGAFRIGQTVKAATVHDAYSRPPQKPKRQSPIFVAPKRASERLPPIVMRLRRRRSDS